MQRVLEPPGLCTALFLCKVLFMRLELISFVDVCSPQMLLENEIILVNLFFQYAWSSQISTEDNIHSVFMKDTR